jgi:hypothetical protein
MKRRKAIIISLCILAVVPAILIAALLLPRRAPDKAAAIPLTKTLGLSRVPG